MQRKPQLLEEGNDQFLNQESRQDIRWLLGEIGFLLKDIPKSARSWFISSAPKPFKKLYAPSMFVLHRELYLKAAGPMRKRSCFWPSFRRAVRDQIAGHNNNWVVVSNILY